MARTHLTLDQVSYPYDKSNATAVKAKQDDHDDALDALEGGGATVVSQIHHVRGASTANIANLAAFTVAGVDGLTYVAGERILLKNQNTVEQNGIYVVGTVGGGTAALTRATDWDAASEIKPNTLVTVAEGTAAVNTFWQITSDFPITVGTTHQHFIQQWNTTAVLTADGPGRALMADDFLDAATVARVVDAKAIDTGSIADSAIEALQLNAEAVTEPKVAPSILTGKHAAVGAAGNTVGILVEEFIITCADGADETTEKTTLDATYGKIVVEDVYFVKGSTTGGATDSVQLCTDAAGNVPVSSALALNNVAEGGVVRTTSLLNTAFAAGAKFYVKRVKTTANNGTMYIRARRVT